MSINERNSDSCMEDYQTECPFEPINTWKENNKHNLNINLDDPDAEYLRSTLNELRQTMPNYYKSNNSSKESIDNNELKKPNKETITDKLLKYKEIKLICGKTGLPPIAFILIFTSFIFLILVGFYEDHLILLLATIYPIYLSYKTLQYGNQEDTKKWLTYWACYCFFNWFEVILKKFLELLNFPFYFFLKVIFILLMYLPQTELSLVLYNNIIRILYNKYHDKVLYLFKIFEKKLYEIEKKSHLTDNIISKNIGKVLTKSLSKANINRRPNTVGISNQMENSNYMGNTLKKNKNINKNNYGVNKNAGLYAKELLKKKTLNDKNEAKTMLNKKSLNNLNKAKDKNNQQLNNNLDNSNINNNINTSVFECNKYEINGIEYLDSNENFSVTTYEKQKSDINLNINTSENNFNNKNEDNKIKNNLKNSSVESLKKKNVVVDTNSKRSINDNNNNNNSNNNSNNNKSFNPFGINTKKNNVKDRKYSNISNKEKNKQN